MGEFLFAFGVIFIIVFIIVSVRFYRLLKKIERKLKGPEQTPLNEKYWGYGNPKKRL